MPKATPNAINRRNRTSHFSDDELDPFSSEGGADDASGAVGSSSDEAGETGESIRRSA
jgi:hypothetical protein